MSKLKEKSFVCTNKQPAFCENSTIHYETCKKLRHFSVQSFAETYHGLNHAFVNSYAQLVHHGITCGFYTLIHSHFLGVAFGHDRLAVKSCYSCWCDCVGGDDEDGDNSEKRTEDELRISKMFNALKNKTLPEMPKNRYCMMSLSGVNGRVMIRSCDEGTYDELCGNIRTWFGDLAIDEPKYGYRCSIKLSAIPAGIEIGFLDTPYGEISWNNLPAKNDWLTAK